MITFVEFHTMFWLVPSQNFMRWVQCPVQLLPPSDGRVQQFDRCASDGFSHDGCRESLWVQSDLLHKVLQVWGYFWCPLHVGCKVCSLTFFWSRMLVWWFFSTWVQVSIILGDEVMLQPDLQTQPMYVCGRPSLYENTDAQSQRAKVVVALQCFCQLNLRPLHHQKPLRRQFLEVSWETWNSLVPERCIMAVIWFLESKLSPQSSGSVTNQTKSVSISGARLKMLLQLEDVDSTYGRFCPNVLAVFDICYLVMLLIMLILSVSLAIVVSRKYLAFKKFVFRTFYIVHSLSQSKVAVEDPLTNSKFKRVY